MHPSHALSLKKTVREAAYSDTNVCTRKVLFFALPHCEYPLEAPEWTKNATQAMLEQHSCAFQTSKKYGQSSTNPLL